MPGLRLMAAIASSISAGRLRRSPGIRATSSAGTCFWGPSVPMERSTFRTPST